MVLKPGKEQEIVVGNQKIITILLTNYLMIQQNLKSLTKIQFMQSFND